MLRNRRDSGKKVGGRKLQTRRCVRFPGLLNDAEAIGEDRFTLYLALSGKRTSERYLKVLKRYHDLKGVGK